MIARRSRIRLNVSALPVEARIAERSLAACATLGREAREQATRAEGFAAGFAEASETASRALDAASEALETARMEAVEGVTETAARLAVEIVQTLLRVEMIAENYDIVSIVRETLAGAGDSPGLTTVHVNPTDAEHLASVPFRTGTRIEADPAIRRGDVEVHTSQGLLVRDLDACVKAIRERILTEVGR